MKRLVTRLPAADLQLVTSDNVLARYSFNARERNCLFVNGRGGRFIEAGYPLGVDVDLEGRGVAVADLDQDGALDLLVRSVARQKLTYFHNETGARQAFLRVELAGTKSNRDAIGAVVRLRAGGMTQARVKLAGSGFQSQSEGTLHFGLGGLERVEELVVRWPSGAEERFRDLGVNQRVRIVEGQGITASGRLPRWRPPPAARVSGVPRWQAKRLDGKPWKGRPGRYTLVSLWASWCGACREEVPQLNALWEKLGGRIDMVGLGLDDVEKARQFVRELGPRYPVAVGDEASLAPLLSVAFGEGAVTLPSAVLLDARGMPVRTFTGRVPVNELERELRSRARRRP